MISRRCELPQLLQRYGLKRGAEVGVAGGHFSAEILKRASTVRELTAIDGWAGDRGHDDAEFKVASDRLRPFGDRVRIRRDSFAAAASGIADQSLDFVYVDGYAHTGNEKGQNYELYWPKVRQGGLFGGHDYCDAFPENVRAVDAFLKNHASEIGGFFTTDGDVYRSWFVWKGQGPGSRLTELQMFRREHLGEGPIVVAGNGPMTENCAMKIAEAQTVIRFNNWNKREGWNEERHGKRCDLLYTHADLREGGRDQGFDPPSRVVLAIPAPFKVDRIAKLVETWWPESTLAMANPYLVRQACLALELDSEGWKHPMPTVGFSFLYHLWRFSESRPVEVFVTGFDWHHNPKTHTYDRVEAGSNRMPSCYNHSYLREATWCSRNLLGRPGWTFSALAQASLDDSRNPE